MLRVMLNGIKVWTNTGACVLRKLRFQVQWWVTQGRVFRWLRTTILKCTKMSLSKNVILRFGIDIVGKIVDFTSKNGGIMGIWEFYRQN